MINFFTLKEELKRSILKRKEDLDVFLHPLDWAWITYALGRNGDENNLLFEEVFELLERWATSEEAGTQQRHLAPLNICASLMPDAEDVRERIMEKVSGIMSSILNRDISKFSLLNDPEQFFCISLTSEGLPELERDKLKKIALKLNAGGLSRRILYTSSLLELGHKPREWPRLDDAVMPEDIISLLWLYERYKGKHEEDVGSVWKSFEEVSPIIKLDPYEEEDDALLSVSNRSIALLYEAVADETRITDPYVLFDVYPLHRRVRQIAEKHFRNGACSVAVFEATKVLNEFIQEQTGVKDKNEDKLVQATMKQISHPSHLKVKFNDFLNEESGKNEQSGLALIAEGLFKAFRNPKGHKASDHPLVDITPNEALNQLIIISYLMDRIERGVNSVEAKVSNEEV
jgi:uncharacterized protein (TIGR02391 family)